jgi:rod shape-determining protein MreD
MRLPLAVIGAVVAALIEASALPELFGPGGKPDLVLVLAVCVTVSIGVEDGLAWAFVGGLLLDVMLAGRPLGTTALACLVAVGLAAVAVRSAGTNRVVHAIVASGVLTLVFQGTVLAVLAATAAAPPAEIFPMIAFVALVNALLAVPVALLIRLLQRRFGAEERELW